MREFSRAEKETLKSIKDDADNAAEKINPIIEKLCIESREGADSTEEKDRILKLMTLHWKLTKISSEITHTNGAPL